MFRTLLILAGFLLVTTMLLLLQPTARAPHALSATPVAPMAVTRDVATPLDVVSPAAPAEQANTPDTLNRAVVQALGATAPDGPTDPTAGTRPSRTRPLATNPAPLDPMGPTSPDALREMSWTALRDIDTALGRHASPGTPGSLLHTIVARSLSDKTGTARIAANRSNDPYLALIQAEAMRID